LSNLRTPEQTDLRQLLLLWNLALRTIAGMYFHFLLSSNLPIA